MINMKKFGFVTAIFALLLTGLTSAVFFVPAQAIPHAVQLKQNINFGFVSPFFSVQITNVANSAQQPAVGFSKDVTFRINSQLNGQFTNTAILNIPNQITGEQTTRIPLGVSQNGQATGTISWASMSQGQQLNVKIEACNRNNVCTTSAPYILYNGMLNRNQFRIN